MKGDGFFIRNGVLQLRRLFLVVFLVEMHIAIIHMICLEIDRMIVKENDGKKN